MPFQRSLWFPSIKLKLLPGNLSRPGPSLHLLNLDWNLQLQRYSGMVHKVVRDLDVSKKLDGFRTEPYLITFIDSFACWKCLMLKNFFCNLLCIALAMFHPNLLLNELARFKVEVAHH